MTVPSTQTTVKPSRRGPPVALLLLPALLLGLWFVWGAVHDPRVSELNGMLAMNEKLRNYPYRFRVFELNEGVAIMSSPRSARSSVLQALKIIDPGLNVSDPNKADVIAAQKRLAELQYKAKNMVELQLDISKVEWRLDREWLLSHGAVLD